MLEEVKKSILALEKEDLEKLLSDEEVKGALPVKTQTQEEITAIVNRALAPKLQKIKTLESKLTEQSELVSRYQEQSKPDEKDTTLEALKKQIENLKNVVSEKDQTYQGLLEKQIDNYKTTALKEMLLERGIDPKKINKALVLVNHELEGLDVVKSEDGYPTGLVVKDDTFGSLDPSEKLETWINENSFLKSGLPSGGNTQPGKKPDTDMDIEKQRFASLPGRKQIDKALQDEEIKKRLGLV